MRVLRSDASYVVSALSILHTLEPYIKNHNDEITIHTSSRGLLNKIHTSTINRPSQVLAYHADVIYQIRNLLQQIKLNINIKYTEAVSPDREIPRTQVEKLMYKMHCRSALYFRKADEKSIPKSTPTHFLHKRYVFSSIMYQLSQT